MNTCSFGRQSIIFASVKLDRDNLALILIWMIATTININKAYHIDDSFHLESAQWIWQHPSTPMSGQINWYDNPEDMSHFNQPPLLFYIIALFGGLFGYSEQVMHLITAGFAFLSLLYFRKIIDYLKLPNKIALMALLGLSPAFIINQNLMTDIPILSLELGFLYHFIQVDKRGKHLIIAMLFLSLALLIKYSMMPLLITAVIILIIRKEFKSLAYCGIPVLALLLWTLWNKWEYGGVHILDRPRNDISIKLFSEQFVALFSCIGAVLPIPILIWSGLLKSKNSIFLVVISCMVFSALAMLAWGERLDMSLANFMLNMMFIMAGSFIFIGVVAVFAQDFVPMLKYKMASWNLNLLSLSIMLGGMTAFLLLYAPFMATRHVLLLMPFMLLLVGPVLARNSKLMLIMSTAIVSILGIVIGISDWRYADTYREMARTDFEHGKEKVWTIGHWGWQWYGKQKGYEFYSKDESFPAEGDLMVFPRHISKQVLDSSDSIEELQTIIYPNKGLSFFSVNGFASLYNSYHDRPAWNFSVDPMDTLVIARFVTVKEKVHSK